MQESDKSHQASQTHRKVQTSTARSRKSVKRPEAKSEKSKKSKKSPAAEVKVEIKSKKPEIEEEMTRPVEKKSKKSTTKAKKSEDKLEAAIKETKKPAVQKIKVVDLDSVEEKSAEPVEEPVEKPAEEAIAESVAEPEAKPAEKTEEASVIMPSADMSKVNARMKNRKESKKPAMHIPTPAKMLKNQAIEKALASASNFSGKTEVRRRVKLDWKRVVLALACATAAVVAIVYFVNVNSPDISLRVAAMQTGIEASYPSHVPRDFTLSDITSENGRITLNFKNSETGASFAIVEEQSSWDSNALLNNYVRKNYGEDYTAVREQGLTIYISNSDATWVNGGVVYKIISGNYTTLTKKQITSIAVSL